MPVRRFLLVLAAGLFSLAPLTEPAGAQEPADTQFTFQEVMIPMRDGIRLFTVIATPRHADGPLPIVLQRTPYGAKGWGRGPRFQTAFGEMISDGYIFVSQDIRGRNGSEGEFIMNHPQHDPRDAKGVDESTDTWDTIDWLVKQLPNNNGKVGVLGISYPGWLAAVAGINPHPALKTISPQAPMGDTWIGDDFFHQGAFRQSYGLEYSWSLEASKDQSIQPNPSRYDLYDWYLSFPTLGALARTVGAMNWPTWRRFTEHPAYDSVWKERALSTTMPRTVIPTLVVGGWWDQEDEYGPLLAYDTYEAHDSAGLNYLVMGPWRHGQWAIDSGTGLGNIRFGGPTGVYYRRELQARWFRHWLKGEGDWQFAEANVFDAGTNSWRTFDHWPPREAKTRSLYLRAGGQLSFDPPRPVSARAGAFAEYVSDPARPVPYRTRPVELTYGRGSRWGPWLTEDQRFVHNRPDVLSWETGPLTESVTVAGDIKAKLFAWTTGSDADWVVKLIDVYPDSVSDRPYMGGYQLMVSADIMRGRYRRSFQHPEAIPPRTVLPYTVDLHQQSYTFEKGHRIMVQVQSTWFPLYDRNPQTFVPNIFRADSSAYRARVHRIYQDVRHPSHLEVMVLER